jgi:peroxin-5
MANSPAADGSKQAVYAYRKAIELKPSYTRAWVNMGISYSNQSMYDLAAKYYLRALSLNPTADHVWSYLRIALECLKKPELIKLVSARDANLFRTQFQF